MKVEILIGGEKKEIEIEEPLGIQQEEYMKRIAEMTAKPKSVMDFIKYRYGLILKLTNGVFKNVDEIKRLPIVEINKLMKPIENRFMALREGFTKT